MSFPNIPNISPTISISVGQTVPLLLGSIAIEELALAHIMNAEAEKLQFVLGTLTPTTSTFSPATVSLSNLLTMNTSVQRTLRDVIKKEMLLEFKFENVLDLIGTLPTSTPITPLAFTFTDPGLHQFTVPAGATRATIHTIGAAGGSSIGPFGGLALGGRGALMQGEFAVTPTEPLAILVGGQGGAATYDGGGGGGSFVWRGSTFGDLNAGSLLVAAGGGGGGGVIAGVDAVTGPSGTDSTDANGVLGRGGSNGNGGTGGKVTGGGGGGGIFTPGTHAPLGGLGGHAISDDALGGQGFPPGVNPSGGFGGGGGAEGSTGGGGGGYSGGGGGYSAGGGGGGGGSFLNGNATNPVTTAGVGTGNGSVTITFF